jgi:hypothetical protein
MESKPIPTPLVRCGGCKLSPDQGETLRRGRCRRCYERWVRARPIGAGAYCVSCGNRRRDQLRHYEVGARLNAAGGRWTLLCHNCAATADGYDPPPRSVDALCQRLARDRRWHDRRFDRAHRDPYAERRASDMRHERRLNLRDLFDATELAEELVIEIEADFEQISEDQLVSLEEITGIHMLTTDEPLLGSPGDDLFLPTATK